MILNRTHASLALVFTFIPSMASGLDNGSVFHESSPLPFENIRLEVQTSGTSTACDSPLAKLSESELEGLATEADQTSIDFEQLELMSRSYTCRENSNLTCTEICLTDISSATAAALEIGGAVAINGIILPPDASKDMDLQADLVDNGLYLTKGGDVAALPDSSSSADSVQVDLATENKTPRRGPKQVFNVGFAPSFTDVDLGPVIIEFDKSQ